MEIKRDILDQFKRWKDSSGRKPILLKGARQIGKTWAMEEFGRRCFDYYVKFDFDRQPELKSIFQTSKDPERIVKELALYSSVPILPEKTLIIFDEIQECDEALNSLKYFCEDAPQYYVMAAGSLLGVAVKRRRMTVPVGKVQILRMYPLSFREFLRASDFPTWEYVEGIRSIDPLPAIILNKLNLEYRRYQVCGGMPEAVVALLENHGIDEVDRCLRDILDLYEIDFAKYAEPKEIPRIRAIWTSLPVQLSKENRKFIYGAIRSGARSKDYEDALMWLEDAGLIYRIFDVSRPGMPLAAYKEANAFKVYGCDCGLIRRMANLPATVVLDPIANYTEFKGALAENTLLQSIPPVSDSELPYYWTSSATAEIEFILQWDTYIIPIEVKAAGNISGNSLALYGKKYNPLFRVRYSSLNMKFNGDLFSCPAPLAGWYPALFPLAAGKAAQELKEGEK